MSRRIVSPLRRIARAFAAAACVLPFLEMNGFAQTQVDCALLAQRFNDAIAQGREFDAHRAAEDTLATPECSAFRMPMLRRLTAYRLTSAQEMIARNRPADEYDGVLVTAESAQILWQASATLGQTRFGQRRFVEAAEAYDRAIELVKSETLTPVSPAPAEIQELLEKAAQARLLAANETPREGAPHAHIKTAAAATGALGGVFSPLVRGIVPRAVPMPITFEYKSAQLTPNGQRAAQELARAIQEQKAERVRVIGHTDPRGGPTYNLKLSKERADAVARYLRESGVTVPIEAEGVGDTQPMRLSPGVSLSQEDIHALNRRVEWRRE
jgi:outer membrane protein OmpA-like peptidoglycan-associated protein